MPQNCRQEAHVSHPQEDFKLVGALFARDLALIIIKRFVLLKDIYSLVVAEVLMMMAFMQASKEIRYVTCTCKIFQT